MLNLIIILINCTLHHAHTHACTHARTHTHARKHARAHTLKQTRSRRPTVAASPRASGPRPPASKPDHQADAWRDGGVESSRRAGQVAGLGARSLSRPGSPGAVTVSRSSSWRGSLTLSAPSARRPACTSARAQWRHGSWSGPWRGPCMFHRRSPATPGPSRSWLFFGCGDEILA